MEIVSPSEMIVPVTSATAPALVSERPEPMLASAGTSTGLPGVTKSPVVALIEAGDRPAPYERSGRA